MTLLNWFYCVLGVVFMVLGVACVVEKYRTVRGGTLLPARILRCEKDPATTQHKGSGGYHFVVEFNDKQGSRHTAATNDAFWFAKEKRVGNVVDIWFNPATPKVVERKSLGAELLCAGFVLLGAVLVLWLGLGVL